MCIGTPTANQLFLERQDSATASRPMSAPQKRTRPLSAKRPPLRPTSAPSRRKKEDIATLNKDSVEKNKRPRDPFKDFLSHDPVTEQLKMERVTEEGYMRECKYDLHHRAILGKLDVEAVKAKSGAKLNLPRLGNALHTKMGLPPVKPDTGIKGLQDLQRDMIQSLKETCENNQEAVGSFIEQREEERRQNQKDDREQMTPGSLNQFKNIFNAVERPETPKKKFVFADGGATPLRNRFRKHHDQYMLEKQDVAQAMQVYQSRRCKPSRKRTVG